MSGWLALVVLMAAVGTIGALFCALAIALLMPWIRRRLQASALSGRSLLLVLVSALPVLTGALLVAGSLGPSLLSALGLRLDHCLAHVDHPLHLCFGHLPSAAPTLTLGAIVITGAGLAASAAWRAGRLLFLGRREANSLATVASARDGVQWIDSRLPLALTVGLFQPRVFMSSGLAEGLDPVELRAAVAHERCHAKERHALLKLAAMVSAMFHTPAIRRELAAWVDLACERRADERAAVAVSDRTRVATALVRAHRLVNVRDEAHRAVALAFANASPSHLDVRVRALLDEPKRERQFASWVVGATLVAMVAANHELHHAVEHMLALMI